ncbi:uncharacterized protein CcaverHIS019_0302690 [Cutaneotrichosporon cavernicola]|uniref:Post-GPI attachment to proteins factor 3 n=1 Tax=Cutaneotrichosporon cavernicola TaxID=279322 RepID=A0AA48KZ84_9TREE|nr:uncharacterized protein CcaverHIS019_0302690 [Cutaneotrichosporon cavernicola]BEI90199.1 hypothetical protein CcaverHIS019_0302690 [Cutaneotrichosporon cavernicola]BEI97978.1 hypothetical protein CcaverHIS631_0302770 [Cutaneotrichosporon cavernicola]BEJ05754.1 hypothetical protein CcaverHIS641_0302760 [Cutaneotrichosporon cavernicola]
MATRTRLASALALFALLALAGPALASSGDRHPSFKLCTSLCELKRCELHHPPLAWHLRALLWTCADDCAYVCGHRLTDEADAGRENYHQFFGKWAFHRIFGIQEPMSVIFSLGNLAVNYRGLLNVTKYVRDDNGLHPWLIVAALVQINTWFWSTIFHMRDLPLTEKLDYFSAMTTVAFMLLYAVIRVFGLQTPKSRSPYCFKVAAAFGVFVLSHFVYVSSLALFPYGYHVGVAMVLGLVSNSLWILWTLSFYIRIPTVKFGNHVLTWPYPYPPRNPQLTARPSQANTPSILVVLTMLAMSLEILDFAPLWRTLDAHSLWHLATIPLGEMWWRFLIKDANDLQVAQGGGRLPLSSASGLKQATD